MKWIEIDRIPEEWKDGRWVLAYDEYGDYRVVQFAKDFYFDEDWWMDHEYRKIRATHVMQLPEPPTPED